MAEPAVNIASWERWASLLAGAALAARALSRFSPAALALGAAGALLIERGLTGHCRLYAALGHSSLGARENENHRIDAASEASFPASDAPAWTSVSSLGGPRAR